MNGKKAIADTISIWARPKRASGAVPPMALGALLIAALALSGCGRKNDLELPPDAQIEGQEQTLPAGTAPKKAPKKDFLLDWLL